MKTLKNMLSIVLLLGAMFCLSTIVYAKTDTSVRDLGRVSVSGAYIMDSPENGKRITAIDYGHPLSIYEKCGSWFHVGYSADGLKGWIPKDHVERFNIPLNVSVYMINPASGYTVTVNFNKENYPLEAWTTNRDSWEKMVLVPTPDGFFALQSYASKQFVTVKNNIEGHPLYCEANIVNSWECLRPAYNYGNGEIGIISQITNLPLAVDQHRDNNPLNTSYDEFGQWQKFKFVPNSTPIPIPEVKFNSSDQGVETNIKTYALKSSGHITTYLDTSMSSSDGYIDAATDEINVLRVRDSDKKVQVSYPTSAGQKIRWIWLSDLTTSTVGPSFAVSKRVNTYRRSDLSQSYGYADPGDIITVLDKGSSVSQISYPSYNGVYKWGWVKTSDIYESSDSSSDSNLRKKFTETALNEEGNDNSGGKYGAKGSNYCAYFVGWVADNSGVSNDIIPRYARVWGDNNPRIGLLPWFVEHDRYYSRQSGYIPKNGDLIFLDWDHKDNEPEHVGIVINTDNNYVYTIEGNAGTNRSVKKEKYSLNALDVFGYGSPAF